MFIPNEYLHLIDAYEKYARLYGKEHCEKAERLSKCTPYSFLSCVKLSPEDLDFNIKEYCEEQQK